MNLERQVVQLVLAKLLEGVTDFPFVVLLVAFKLFQIIVSFIFLEAVKFSCFDILYLKTDKKEVNKVFEIIFPSLVLSKSSDFTEHSQLKIIGKKEEDERLINISCASKSSCLLIQPFRSLNVLIISWKYWFSPEEFLIRWQALNPPNTPTPPPPPTNKKKSIYFLVILCRTV